ncbi:short-chain dehydrogenase reductase sdr [Moniliophthora roreri MCA 2997]|uniref:Short-chain dehydrogenase reductase sdr n=2 Tax=Moniliophthora roreri TaxID=221103 RepID=V2YUB4_MONRO|nr:short-chain dehydrogenase reductase sdr [Moniliophthora roreri MCA 2997]KAI3616266.1 short-chain dehydrogenase reductase sdr [Moniliophthora roreri]
MANAEQPSIFIIGAGPQIATAVAKIFASNGFSVDLSSRSQANLQKYKALLPEGTKVAGTIADAEDPYSGVKALESLKSELGAPSAVLWNAGSLEFSLRAKKSITDVTIEDMEKHMRMNVVSGFAVMQWGVKNVVPDSEGRSAVFVTGGGLSLQPMVGLSGLGAGKAALLNLGRAFRLEVPEIHVATVIVNGYVDQPDGDPFSSSPVIAKEYWQLYIQKKEDWTFEVEH